MMMKPFNNHFLNAEFNITFNEIQLLMMGDGVNEKE